MSSALWHFFWNTADWGGAPPAPPPPPASPPQDPGSGGGSKSRDDYFPANEDYWEARAAYLRSLQQEMALELPVATVEPSLPAAPAPAHPKFGDWRVLPRLQAERTAAIERVQTATNAKQLQANVTRLLELNTAIRQHRAAKAAWDADRPRRVAKRNKTLRRVKKVLAPLMAIQALLSLLARS